MSNRCEKADLQYVAFLKGVQERKQSLISLGDQWRNRIPVEIWIQKEEEQLKRSCWQPSGCHRPWTTYRCSCPRRVFGINRRLNFIPCELPLPPCCECGEFGGLPKQGSWLCIFCDDERWSVQEQVSNLQQLLLVFEKQRDLFLRELKPWEASQKLDSAWRKLREHGGCPSTVDQSANFEEKIRAVEKIAWSWTPASSIARMELDALKIQRDRSLQSIRSFQNCDESCEYHAEYRRSLEGVERVRILASLSHLYVQSSDQLNIVIIRLICMGLIR